MVDQPSTVRNNNKMLISVVPPEFELLPGLVIDPRSTRAASIENKLSHRESRNNGLMWTRLLNSYYDDFFNLLVLPMACSSPIIVV